MALDFPYIKAVKINDCYTYKDLHVQIFEEEPFRHLILTGKNGSGKTTTLRGIAYNLEELKAGGLEALQAKLRISTRGLSSVVRNTSSSTSSTSTSTISSRDQAFVSQQFKKFKAGLGMIDLEFSKSWAINIATQNDSFVYSYFKAYRRTRTNTVTTVTNEFEIQRSLQAQIELIDALEFQDDNQRGQKQLSNYFKQYLVNKRVSQAFDQLESNQQGLKQSQAFFDSFTNLLKDLFDDKGLQLVFVREQFEFFISLSDGRKVTFNHLSEGFSAFLSIITELFMKVDFIRREVKDYNFDPPGIVLIDEPEVHLHLEMQYRVLPVLTSLFPNIQFIVATHSPAVASSIANATIYDLSSQVTRKEQVAGSSFSELMLTHFGLENEFSPVADRIIEQVNGIIENVQDKQQAKAQLQQLLEANRQVLTPSLQLELESAILELEND